MTEEDRRPTDWSDKRLADAFLARAALRPTPPDLAAATLERVRRSSSRSTPRPGLRSIGALAAAAVVVAVAVGLLAPATHQRPGVDATEALGLPILTVSQAINIRDAGAEDREIAVSGYLTGPAPLSCPFDPEPANPTYLRCPGGTTWLMEQPESLITIGNDSMSGRDLAGPAINPSFAQVDAPPGHPLPPRGGSTPTPVVLIGHFDDRRAIMCPAESRPGCMDTFIVDRVDSVEGNLMAPNVRVDLDRFDGGLVPTPVWTSTEVVERLRAVDPSLEPLSVLALPGSRVAEIEPALGTGALGIIDRPVAWVVTGLDAGTGGTAPVRRTFLLVDDTAEAYETVPWDLGNVGFVPFPLIGTPLAPSASPVTLDLVDATGRHLSVEVVDESGLLESAAPVAPGEWPADLATPGNDIAVGQVSGEPNKILLGWVGGACDGPMRFTIRPDGRTILAEQGPSEGDGDSFCILIGIQRRVILTFSAPVPAAEVEIVKASAQPSPAPSESPTVSTVVGDPITVTEALERRDSQLDDTEIAVRGFVWSPADATCQLSLGRPKSPLLPQCPGDLSVLADGPQPASPSPGVPEPVMSALSLLTRPETYVGERITPAEPPEVGPVEVIAIGHFDDHRAAQCPPAQVETCRRTFVVDVLVDAEQPGLDLNAIEAVRPDPSIQTVVTAADVERVATGAPRGAGIVLATFAVPGSAVAGFEPQAAESSELTSAAAVWIVRYVDVGIEETRPVLKTKLIIDGPIDSLGGSIYVPWPGGLAREVTVID